MINKNVLTEILPEPDGFDKENVLKDILPEPDGFDKENVLKDILPEPDGFDKENVLKDILPEPDGFDKEDKLRNNEEVRKNKLENDNTETEIGLKKGICKWVKWVVSLYLIFIAFILVVLVFNKGKLDNSVIIALLTTTTINIIGLPLMIIKSLFSSKFPSEKELKRIKEVWFS